MLAIENLQVSYGSIAAVNGVDISVAAGEIVAVIGPNGAGKSTLLLTIAGVVKAKAGSVQFDGRAILGEAPEKLAASGLALVNMLGALAGFVSPLYRLWAETHFGAGAGLLAIGLTTAIGALMIALAGQVVGRTAR